VNSPAWTNALPAGRVAARGASSPSRMSEGCIHHITSRGRSTAFTLVELLVVTAILALVVSVIGACLSGGIRAWETAREFGSAEAQAAIGLRILERDIMNSFPFYAVPMTGSREEITFAGPVRGGETMSERIGTVLYRYDRYRGTLERKTWTFPGEEPQAGEIVVPVAASLVFRYRSAPDGAWAEAWTDVTNRPFAIEVELGLDDSPSGLTITRTIIPAIRFGTGDDEEGS
jgi:prepilin-type N-terminal cleavage/methylation domain-containing protein